MNTLISTKAAAHRLLPCLLPALLVLGLLTAPVSGMAAPPPPFEAVYELYRNGKLAGEAHIRFTVDGEQWTLASSSKGTKGMARFLGLEESSTSNGGWGDAGPVPLHFERQIEVSFKTIITSAQFDWQALQVLSRFDGQELQVPIEPGVVDAVSEGLAIRAGLASGDRHWLLKVLDEDEIETHEYAALQASELQTALGCQPAVAVARQRGEHSTRYTRSIHAVDLAWVPLQMEHGKTDGAHMETRITSLTLNGRPVTPGPPCP